ncbi:gibberellin 2-beta-dioxygenase 6-like isoform X2 [Zingiber officinale]|uniref:gibberellin 2-beta-dioxygenase 6-like isoform X2 n=1 Tax=Zingiber officinale TaxID=94328 RepID=UPI001C4B2909|nr:gibberellin 2-beta-dioxygenase 6-like isoform X2 [Zingiber officinale]
MASPEKDQAPVHPPPPPDPELVSYPPFFLQCNAGVGGAPPPPPLPPRAISSFDVVAIDLQRLDAASLGEACRQWGLFRLVNHGIPTALKAEIEAEARRLLSLPFDAKAARFACPSIAYFWGTPAMNLPLKKLNWVEGLHIPLANLRSDRSAVDFDGFETFRDLPKSQLKTPAVEGAAGCSPLLADHLAKLSDHLRCAPLIRLSWTPSYIASKTSVTN